MDETNELEALFQKNLDILRDVLFAVCQTDGLTRDQTIRVKQVITTSLGAFNKKHGLHSDSREEVFQMRRQLKMHVEVREARTGDIINID